MSRVRGQLNRVRIGKSVGACMCLMILTASAVTAKKQSRLASDAVMDASERAPLNPFATSGRWNTPCAPFKVIGNIYYVGTAGVSSYLITSPKGHILIDGILAQSVPQIIRNVKALGFDIKDVKYLLSSHAHIDHAGGLAGLQRASGATMIASAADKPFLESGDIGHGPSAGMKFPPIRVDRLIGDGETVSVGGVTLEAHLTPGHSPGCTSWSMATVGADRVRRQIFFHCSGTVAGQSLMPEAYPGIVANFRKTFAKVRMFKADVFLANHDNFFDLAEKRARQIAGDANAFVDTGELQRFNTLMEQRFEAELGGKK
jgi:metallo-beta-lactamase class B